MNFTNFTLSKKYYNFIVVYNWFSFKHTLILSFCLVLFSFCFVFDILYKLSPIERIVPEFGHSARWMDCRGCLLQRMLLLLLCHFLVFLRMNVTYFDILILFPNYMQLHVCVMSGSKNQGEKVHLFSCYHFCRRRRVRGGQFL